MSIRRVAVTAEQVMAARLRVLCDQKLHRTTPDWVVKLSRTPLTATRSQ